MVKKSEVPGSTREKIMQVAFDLFGRYGVEGTSIRKIAEEAGVNLAAVNYHFKNKENLYWEIMIETFKEVDHDMALIQEKAGSLSEMAGLTFDYFFKESLAVRNAMTMMMTEGMGEPSTEEGRQMMNDPLGAPGGKYLADMIQKEISYPLNQEGALWAVKTIFGAIVHWTMICCHEKNIGATQPMMSPKQFRKDAGYLAESTLSYLRQNQKKFEDKRKSK